MTQSKCLKFTELYLADRSRDKIGIQQDFLTYDKSRTNAICWRNKKKILILIPFSIDDTANFDEFPDVDLKIPSAASIGPQSKDWVFINYTFKRFEGLTQRGPIPKMI